MFFLPICYVMCQIKHTNLVLSNNDAKTIINMKLLCSLQCCSVIALVDLHQITFCSLHFLNCYILFLIKIYLIDGCFAFHAVFDIVMSTPLAKSHTNE